MILTRLRPLAEVDLIERTRHYRLAGGADLGTRFFDKALATLRTIEQAPGAGSPLIGELCAVPGLRSRRVPSFPCRWFYVVKASHIDIVRLLADAQDLTDILGQLDTDD